MDISNFLNNLNEKNEKKSKDEVSANDEKLIEILQEISNDYLQEEEIEELKFFNIAEVELDNISPPIRPVVKRFIEQNS